MARQYWLLIFLALAPAAAREPVKVINPDFSQWSDDQPKGWDVQIGATNGAIVPESVITKGEGPSLELRGNARTRAWKMVRQTVRVNPGETLKLTVRARVAGIKREARQFNNCHVGLWPKDKNGKGLGHFIETIYSTEFDDFEIIGRIPPEAVTADIVIFLSKTGELAVDSVALSRYTAEESFALLMEELKSRYSYLEYKKVDLPALQERYGPLAAAAQSDQQFAEVVAQMFAEFKDLHTWVMLDGRKIQQFVSGFDANYNFRFVDERLTRKKSIGTLGLVGVTESGFGYLRVETMSGVSDRDLQTMRANIRLLYDTPGFIVDLRRNRGGAEPVGQAIAAMFTDQEYVYARQKFRDGNDLVETPARRIRPASGRNYVKPVVCLCGPGAVSSGEGFVLMMKSSPNCTLIGQPTRGASGNPQAVPLPNGVDAWFSRWQAMTPDGDMIEDVGVQPDILVEHPESAENDPAFEAAVMLLSGAGPPAAKK